MRRLVLKNLLQPPVTEAPPARRRCRRLPSLPRNLDRAAQAPARPQPGHSRGRRWLVQWLRARDPRAEQRLLRSRALRLALRRLAAPCRRAAGDGPGHQEHARGAAAHLQRDARPEMGGGGRRLRRQWRHLRRQLCGGRGSVARSCPSICTSAAARRGRSNY